MFSSCMAQLDGVADRPLRTRISLPATSSPISCQSISNYRMRSFPVLVCYMWKPLHLQHQFDIKQTWPTLLLILSAPFTTLIIVSGSYSTSTLVDSVGSEISTMFASRTTLDASRSIRDITSTSYQHLQNYHYKVLSFIRNSIKIVNFIRSSSLTVTIRIY